MLCWYTRHFPPNSVMCLAERLYPMKEFLILGLLFLKKLIKLSNLEQKQWSLCLNFPFLKFKAHNRFQSTKQLVVFVLFAWTKQRRTRNGCWFLNPVVSWFVPVCRYLPHFMHQGVWFHGVQNINFLEWVKSAIPENYCIRIYRLKFNISMEINLECIFSYENIEIPMEIFVMYWGWKIKLQCF